MADAGDAVLLAVDGGASKTDALIVGADGTVLGAARGPGSNHQTVGLDHALANLSVTIEAAAAQVDLLAAGSRAPGQPLCALGVYCLAGLDLPIDDERVGDAVRNRRWTEACDVRNDTFAVLRAGAGAAWGVAVVCGSGLNCVGLGPDGRSVRFPSLGELSGDLAQGGGWLGRRGLGLALRAGDGRGDPTVLRELIPRRLGLDSPEAVLEALYGGRLDFAGVTELAPVVLEAAEAGDGPAVGAVELLAQEATAMAVAAIHRLGIGDSPVQVVVGGGMFESPFFAHRVLEEVRRHVPAAALRPLNLPPVVGAALLGLDELAGEPDVEARLLATLPTLKPAAGSEPAGAEMSGWHQASGPA